MRSAVSGAAAPPRTHHIQDEPQSVGTRARFTLRSAVLLIHYSRREFSLDAVVKFVAVPVQYVSRERQACTGRPGRVTLFGSALPTGASLSALYLKPATNPAFGYADNERAQDDEFW